MAAILDFANMAARIRVIRLGVRQKYGALKNRKSMVWATYMPKMMLWKVLNQTLSFIP